jgi:hypothetical protein
MGVARTRFFPAAATDRGHGREELRTLEAVTLTAWLAYPHAAQALRITGRIWPLCPPDGRVPAATARRAYIASEIRYQVAVDKAQLGVA